MTSVHDVAAYVLSREGNLSTMKLQKLCYYAQGWHLAWHGRPLFDDPLEAWRMGPVCPELYKHHRGKASVDQWPLGSHGRIPSEGTWTLDVVIDFYGPFSGFDLGHRTHSERPWIEAWEEVEPKRRGSIEISTETLKQYFTMLTKQSAEQDD